MESTDVSSDDDSNGGCNDKPHQANEVISFGDSNEERTAVQIVSKQLNATSKSVMFVSSPTPVQIIGQLQLISQYMRYVCEHKSTIDLEIIPELAEACADKYLRKAHRMSDYLQPSNKDL